MANDITVHGLHTAAGQKAIQGGRPLVNKKTGQTQIRTPRGMVMNSALRKDEWEELDRAVVAAAVQPLTIVPELDRLGLVRRIGSLGTLMAQYNTVSEMTPADVSLRGHASGEKDLVDYELKGVPIPVISKQFELDERYLQSGRMLGDGIDVSNGEAAARVVSEKIEDMIINGESSVNLNGNTIDGLTTHDDRNTDTATNYGGGDWGTVTNVVPTIKGMISAAQDDGYYGPYGIWAANTQFNEAALVHFTDGSGDTPMDRILRMPQISFMRMAPFLAAGTVLLVQLSTDVIQIAYVQAYWPVTNLEWTSGDGMLNSFKVMSVYAPIVKSAYGGKSGIVHATGA